MRLAQPNMDFTELVSSVEWQNETSLRNHLVQTPQAIVRKLRPVARVCPGHSPTASQKQG